MKLIVSNLETWQVEGLKNLFRSGISETTPTVEFHSHEYAGLDGHAWSMHLRENELEGLVRIMLHSYLLGFSGGMGHSADLTRKAMTHVRAPSSARIPLK